MQDHDVFGTDENDEDSMDSLMLSREAVTRLASDSLVHDSGCDLRVACDSQASCSDSRASSRLSHVSDVASDVVLRDVTSDVVLPPLPADHDDSTMSSETIAIENNILSSDLKPTSDSKNSDDARQSPNAHQAPRAAHARLAHLASSGPS